MTITDTANHSRVFLWINVLVGAIIAAVAATIIDNIAKGTFRERAHNSLLLANECLSEHQSAYIVYFIALLGTTDFSIFWAKPVLPEVLFASFVIYVISVALTADHEEPIRKDHRCSTQGRCTSKIPISVKWTVMRWNVVFAIIMFFVAVAFAVMTTRAPG